MPDPVKLQLHIAQEIALSDPTGIPDGFEVVYPTTDGRVLRLPHAAAVDLNALDLAPGELFIIRKETTRERLITFRFWREEDAGRPARPEQPAPPAIGPQLIAPRRQARPEQPRLFDYDMRGTGTYGPAPRRAPARPLRPGPIPFNIAFQECLQFVKAELDAIGERWGDEAKQAAVCTVLIAAAKAGYVGPWER